MSVQNQRQTANVEVIYGLGRTADIPNNPAPPPVDRAPPR